MTSQHPIPPHSHAPTLPNRPTAWSIAGSDSSGGTGIQADLMTMHGLGVHGCTVVTAVTAQNTHGVAAVERTSPELVEAQLIALENDLPPKAIKIGMLGDGAILECVARSLEKSGAYVVCDPVLAATRGGALLDPAAHDVLIRRLFPRVHLLTPNLPEAKALLGMDIDSPQAMEQAARALLGMGVKSVLLKGGHRDGPFAQDYWTDGQTAAWLTSERIDTPHTHGGGCTLSSAIAAGVALGLAPLDAVVLGKAYVNQGLRTAGGPGSGRGSLGHGGWPAHPEDMPWISATAEAGQRRLVFPTCGGEPLGLYPIVDRTAWLAKLLPLGVKTIQLRIKDLRGGVLEDEIASGIRLARHHNARLFVNDHWELALKHGAYGVHIGQDDMPGADLEAIQQAGLRLGLSTHGLAEIARSLAVVPSYIAVGTVFTSPSKTFEHRAIGMEGFRRLRSLVGVPVVAIGGITLERAEELRAAGADGIAVISDVTRAEDLKARVASWLRLWRS
jgi:hydroxymethylpyrimidine kinase/phosphomethylpyrimidine kinase/thiamine-phosphate diphosphorylase